MSKVQAMTEYDLHLLENPQYYGLLGRTKPL